MNDQKIELTRPEDHESIKRIVTSSLESEGIEYDTEKWLDDKSRVDVFYDGIVVEIKSSYGVIDESKLVRYENHPQVREVVLAMPEPHARRVETGDRRVIPIPREKFTLSL
jgi:hypothetical protein